jgi:hypothetical protein
VPRYFFHICDDDGVVPDREGMDFADDNTAKAEGEASARDLLREHLRANRDVDNQRVQVEDSSGVVVATYHLRDLLN